MKKLFFILVAALSLQANAAISLNSSCKYSSEPLTCGDAKPVCLAQVVCGDSDEVVATVACAKIGSECPEVESCITTAHPDAASILTRVSASGALRCPRASMGGAAGPGR